MAHKASQPFPSHPEENLESGPDVAAVPATLEVKVKGKHVKFATHHHFLDRQINRSDFGGEIRCRGEVGGEDGAATEQKN